MSITPVPNSPSWYVLLEASPEDIVAFKKHFSNSGFSFDDIDEKFALAAPQFEACASGDTSSVIGAATELLNAVNVVLRLSEHSKGFEFFGVAEKRNDAIHRTLLCGTGAYRISGGNVCINGKSVRTKEERLVSLMGSNDGIKDAAHALSVLPMTWAALAMVYETAKGIMSTKPQLKARRKDHENLVTREWLTVDESDRFYKTAGFYKHGHPREPIGIPNPMSYEDACVLIVRLFWRLVDELEPG